MAVSITLDQAINLIVSQSLKKPVDKRSTFYDKKINQLETKLSKFIAKVEQGKSAALNITGNKVKYQKGTDNTLNITYKTKPLVDFDLVPFEQQLENIDRNQSANPAPNPTPTPPPSPDFTLTNGVVDAPAASPQIRATFASAEVGNGSANNLSSQLAVAFQQENTAGTLTGGILRGSDEGVVYTAKNGQTFDVRDVSGTQRGDKFTTVILGSSAADAISAATTASYMNGGQGNDVFTSGAGADFMVGGAGNDRFIAGTGDSIIGGDGTDTVELAGKSTDYTVTDTAEAVTLTALDGSVITLVKTNGVNTTESVKFSDATVTVASLLAPGATFTLTTAANTISPTEATAANRSTNGNDKVVGLVAAAGNIFQPSVTTLNNTDSIDLGVGLDTAEIELRNNFAGFTTGAMRNVETLKLTNTGTALRTFSGVGTSDVTRVELTGDINVTALNSLASVVVGERTADLSVGFAIGVASGNNDAIALNLANQGTFDDPTTPEDEDVDVAITLLGVENVSTALTGANQVDATGLAATNWTLSGSGSATLLGVATALKTLDASQVSGAIVVDLANATSMTSVKLGAGNDTLTINPGGLTADVLGIATLAGGAGEDTLVMTGTAGNNAYNMTGFETLKIGALSGTQTVSLASATGLSKIVATDAFNTSVAIANAGATNQAVVLAGANANGTAALALDNSGNTTILVTEPVNAAATTNALDVTLTQSKGIALTVDTNMVYTGAITAAEAATVTVTANGAFNGNLVTAKASELTITAVNTASTINIDAAQLSKVTIANSKSLTLTGPNSAATVKTSGTGDITFGALAAVTSATFANNASITTGALGSASLASAMTISSMTATAATLGTITTKDANITTSLTGASGAINIGAVSAGTGNVSITAGTTGNVSLAAITGKDVTLDVDAVLGSVTYADDTDITATGNVTWNAARLVKNDLVVALTGAAAQTVTVTGGNLDDSLTITAAKGATITGTMDIGTDTVTATLTGAGTLSVSGLAGYERATLTGSADADTLTAGVGIDTFVQAVDASVASTKLTQATSGTFTVGDTITFGSGVDVINGFTAGAGGDKLDLAAATAATSRLDQSSTGLAVGSNYFLSGTYRAGVFTITANGTGADTLIIQGLGGADYSTNQSSIVLVGVDSDNLVDANII